MTTPFTVRTTPRFERLARPLRKRHPEFQELLARAFEILKTDPYNHARTHNIKKLEGVPVGEGPWRLTLRHFRFRYDVYDRDVVLQYCGLRREDTYR
jgi:hypothetical protein